MATLLAPTIGASPTIIIPPQDPGVLEASVNTIGKAAVPFKNNLPPFSTNKASDPSVKTAVITDPASIVKDPPFFTFTVPCIV